MGYASGQARYSGVLPVGPGGGGGGATSIMSSDSSISVVEAPPGTFDLTADATSVGAVDITGDTMQGPLLMDGYNLVMGAGGTGGPGNITTIGSAAATVGMSAPTFTGNLTGDVTGDVNGVTLETGGAASEFLSRSGSYLTPADAQGASVLTFGGGSIPQAGTADRFLSPWNDRPNAETTEFAIIWPVDGTFDQMRAEWDVAANSVNITCVLRIEAADTAVTFTALANSGAGTDLTNSVAVAAGQRVSCVVRKSAGTGTNMGDFTVSFRFTPS